jgi:hypothetical protein
VPSTIPHLSRLHCDVIAYRQYGGADLVLRSASGQVIQCVSLRDKYNEWACGELARANVGDKVETFGTIMMNNFLLLVDPEDLSCKEIAEALPTLDTKALLREIHASIKNGVDRGDGGDLVRVGKFNVYSTARRILETVGKMKNTELKKDWFNTDITLK